MSLRNIERRRVEDRLEAAPIDGQLAAIVEFAEDAIISKNLSGLITSWNPGAERLFGYAASEVIGQPCTLIHPPEVRETEAQLLEQIANGERVDQYESVRRRKDGSLVEVSITLSAIKDRRGNIIGASKLIHDITQRKRAEQELRRKSAELIRSNAELEQFAYVASHDLQEPLRMIASYLDLLTRRYEDQLDEKARRWIRFAIDGSTRMKQLIEDLLQFARVSSRGKPFTRTSCEHVFETATSNLTRAIHEARAEVTRGSLPTVSADPTQLTQVFQNLIGNAVKYRADQPPKVRVSAARGCGEWVFAIQDNGIGIDPQYHDRIFALFQRLHGKNEYPGTGIGLALCRKILQRHGGRIWVESSPGSGSKFLFTLPDKLREIEAVPDDGPERTAGDDSSG